MKKQGVDKAKSASQDSELRRLMKMVEKTPDVRKEKIEAIKRQIEQGTYSVSGKVVADSIAGIWRDLK